jgi:hypothetical protein
MAIAISNYLRNATTIFVFWKHHYNSLYVLQTTLCLFNHTYWPKYTCILSKISIRVGPIHFSLMLGHGGKVHPKQKWRFASHSHVSWAVQTGTLKHRCLFLVEHRGVASSSRNWLYFLSILGMCNRSLLNRFEFPHLRLLVLS